LDVIQVPRQHPLLLLQACDVLPTHRILLQGYWLLQVNCLLGSWVKGLVKGWVPMRAAAAADTAGVVKVTMLCNW
jgi:hypothetical protein